MTELRKNYTEEQMQAVARQAMAEATSNQNTNPGGPAATKIPYNLLVPMQLPVKTPEQRSAEAVLAKMANRQS